MRPGPRTAWISGAGSGIGYALCLALLARGDRVWAIDRQATGLRRLKAAVGSHADLTTVELDVSDAEAVTASQQALVARHGRIDMVFNNAGILAGGPVGAMRMDDWRRIIDVNLWGVIHGSQAAWALMQAQGGGHIVNTASSAGLMPVAGMAAYTASKHAVVGLSTTLREEGRALGIRVSCVIPGLVDTGIFRSAINLDGHDTAAHIDRQPIGKITPAQAAQHILKGVERNQRLIIFPAYNRLLIWLYRLAPGLTGRLINRGAAPS